VEFLSQSTGRSVSSKKSTHKKRRDTGTVAALVSWRQYLLTLIPYSPTQI